MPHLHIDIMTKLFKIQGFFAKNIKKNKNKVVIEIEKIEQNVCPVCGSTGKKYDSKYREILIGYLLGNKIYAKVKVNRIKCDNCGIKTEKLDFVERNKRYSKESGKEIKRYTKHLSNQSLSELTGISNTTIYRIDKSQLSKRYEEHISKIDEVYNMCIDEVSIKKGHKYLTVFTNYDTSKVIWLEKGRKSNDCERGLVKLKPKLNNLHAVSMDLWKAYEKAVDKVIGKDVLIVFDKFHLAKLLNKAIEEERRDYQNKISFEERLEIKKHYRWILLKRYSNLDNKGLSI